MLTPCAAHKGAREALHHHVLPDRVRVVRCGSLRREMQERGGEFLNGEPPTTSHSMAYPGLSTTRAHNLREAQPAGRESQTRQFELRLTQFCCSKETCISVCGHTQPQIARPEQSHSSRALALQALRAATGDQQAGQPALDVTVNSSPCLPQSEALR
jgi:hypothetical protein